MLRNNYLQTLALSLAERRGVGDLGFAPPPHAQPRAGGPPRPQRRVPARRRDPRRARPARRGADAARACGASRLRQALAARRASREPRCRTIPISPASSSATSRREMRERFPDAIAGPPPAARDHRDAARQRDHQPRRSDDRDAPRRPDRRRRADDRRGLRGHPRFVRARRSQRRHRRPRRHGHRAPCSCGSTATCRTC